MRCADSYNLTSTQHTKNPARAQTTMGSTAMNAAMAMEGIPSIDEVLATPSPEESSTTATSDAINTTTKATTNASTSAAYETVATIQVPPLPARSANHTRYYSISGAADSSSAHLSAIANPVDNEAGSLAVGGTEPPRRRSRSRSLFSFRSSSSRSSSSNSPRSSLDYGDDDAAAVAAARRSGKGQESGIGPFRRRSRSRTTSVHAAAVLPAVLVLGAECFTPGHGGEQGK